MEENLNSQQAAGEASTSPAPEELERSNIIWIKKIPKMNTNFLLVAVIMLLASCVLSFLAVGRIEQIRSYLSLMFPLLVKFMIFVLIENKVLSKKFATSTSSLDGKLIALITMRNAYFVVMLSPFVGMLYFYSLFVSWIPFLIYIVLIWMRLKEVKKADELKTA